MMQKLALLTTFIVVFVAPVLAEELRPPLEKQFFDYFNDRCEMGMNAEIKATGKNPQDSMIADAVNRYCACTAQAIVSYLSAGEIIAFANNPEEEPAASKMKPYFVGCHGKGNGSSL